MTFLLRPGIFDAEIDCPVEDFIEPQTISVEAIGPGRLQVMESSGLFDSYRLLCGDEIEVREVAEKEYELIRVVQPSAMCHYFSILGGGRRTERLPGEQGDGLWEALDHSGFTKALHELGGEWEADMGGLFTVHVPRCNRKILESRTGWRLDEGSEVFSGPVDLSMDD